MIEMLVLFTFVGFVAYRVAVVAEKRRRKSPTERKADRERLLLRQAWLKERIERSHHEKWSDHDRRPLEMQLEEVESDLADHPEKPSGGHDRA